MTPPRTRTLAVTRAVPVPSIRVASCMRKLEPGASEAMPGDGHPTPVRPPGGAQAASHNVVRTPRTPQQTRLLAKWFNTPSTHYFERDSAAPAEPVLLDRSNGSDASCRRMSSPAPIKIHATSGLAILKKQNGR